VVELIPPAFNFPELTCASIIWDDVKYLSKNYFESNLELSRKAVIDGKVLEINVFCKKEAVILNEEHDLLDEVKNKMIYFIKHKRAERELQEKQYMFQRTQEIGDIGSFEMNLNTGEVTWSDQLYKLFGLEKIGKTLDYEKVIALIHPDDREKAIKVSSEAAEKREPYTLEHRVIHPDGDIFDLLITGDVITEMDSHEITKIGALSRISLNKRETRSR
jgi:PAS domain-containing protein